METLPKPFHLHIADSGYISQAEASVENNNNDNTDHRIPATTGPKDSAATFTLTDGRLESESGDWILGRDLVEDRSLLPKAVYWFSKNNPWVKVDFVQKTVVEHDGGEEYCAKNGSTYS